MSMMRTVHVGLRQALLASRHVGKASEAAEAAAARADNIADIGNHWGNIGIMEKKRKLLLLWQDWGYIRLLLG